MASKKIEGLSKSKGAFGVTIHSYRGAKIKQGTGRFKSPYEFQLQHNDKNHRGTATNLNDAVSQIDKILGKQS